MPDLLQDPVTWLAAGTVVFALTAGLLAYLLALYVWPRYPLVEPEPAIDMDLFEAEMSMEAALLEDRLCAERRAEMAARLQ